MFFAAFPPEINSGRMYTGSGSGPLLAAAAAWDDLASELQSAAASYSSVISGLTSGPWLGPSSLSMAAAVTPYLTWMQGTAAQAAETASQATAAASAYETAFAAHVPPEEIAANRSQLASLVGDQHCRAEQRGDRGHRSPIRRNVGPGRPGDGHLRRLVGGRLQVDAVHRRTAGHQRQRAGQPGGRGGPSRCHPGRQCGVARDSSGQPAHNGRPLLQALANLSTDYTDTLNGLVNSVLWVRGINVIYGPLQRHQGSTWLHDRVQRRRPAHQLPRIAVPQIHPGRRVRPAPERGAGRRAVGPWWAGAG